MRTRLAILLMLLFTSACSTFSSQAPVASAMPDAASLVAIADAARNEGRFSDALEIYTQALVSDPKAVAAQYGAAECLLALGKPNESLRIFTALQQDMHVRALALQGSGLADLILDHRDEAAGAFHLAIANDPKLWRAYNGLGLIADLQHQPEQARNFYNQALTLQPESAILFKNRGYSRLLAGHPDEAVADFRKALALDPNSETILNNLRLAIAAQGDYREATRDVPREKIPVVMNNVGYIAMQRGDLAAAEAYLSQAVTENPYYDTVANSNMNALIVLKGSKK